MSDEAIELPDDGRPNLPTEFSTSGPITNGQRRAIETMVDRVIGSVDDGVLHARIRAEHSENAKPAAITVRVVLEIKGGPVRAHVVAETVHEAIDAVEHRLRRQLRHRAERRQAMLHRGTATQPGEWRHGDLVPDRRPFYPRPVDERRIVRHKSFAPTSSTVEEAIFDLESMSYHFFLFVEEGSGRDALVAVQDDGGYSVHYLDGPGDEAARAPAGLAVDQHPAPSLDLAAAEERLDAGNEPWVFFADAATGRGHVLYRRYDGHYGLIVPVDEPD